MTNRAEGLLQAAYGNLNSDNFDHDFVNGCLAEALAIMQGDWASFDDSTTPKFEPAKEE